jgi:hypothetical protein
MKLNKKVKKYCYVEIGKNYVKGEIIGICSDQNLGKFYLVKIGDKIDSYFTNNVYKAI